MREQQADNEGSMTEAMLVRLAADGELSERDAARLEALRAGNPQIDHAIEQERALRAAVGRVMGSVAAPHGLRERVVAGLRESEAADAGVESRGEQTRRTEFWRRRSVAGAIAAALLMALTAGLLWQALSLSRVPLDETQMAFRQQLVGFVSSEHARTLGSESARESKLVMHEEVQASAALTEKLAHRVALPDCGARKLKFLGAGFCKVPGQGASAHLMIQPEIGPMLSLFVKEYSGELPMVEGQTYVVDTKACGEAGTRIFAWLEDGLAYFLVLEEVAGCEKVLAELGISLPKAGI
jgi:hypothetical protein